MATRVLVLSDDGVSSGYGRISMEVNKRLHKRGYDVIAASPAYDGLLRPQLDGEVLPYWVASLQGKDIGASLNGLIQALQPQIIHVIQDATYAVNMRNMPVDWSRIALVITTPVDGTPVLPQWIETFHQADGMLTISQFGVEAHRAQGVRSVLCRPGVELNRFYPYPAEKREALRARLGLKSNTFLLMSACMNQGRKAIPSMLQGFFAFAADKPNARYLLDMDKTSPAGWDIPAICEQQGWDASKLIFREDAIRAGLPAIEDRYNCADVHAVLSFREGYGLPLVEAMACGVVSIAQDYCSGTEICGGGKGVLIPSYTDKNGQVIRSIGTWGGAEDRFPDVQTFTEALETLYQLPDFRRHTALKGMAWAREQTWDKATDAVAGVYEDVLRRRAQRLPPEPQPQPTPTPPPPPRGVVIDEAGALYGFRPSSIHQLYPVIGDGVDDAPLAGGEEDGA